MKISIQQRKAKGGKLNLRLEFYHGYSKTPEGKIRHQREYENLEGFLYENPKTPAEKEHNKQQLQLAEAIRAKRVVEAQNGKHGFRSAAKTKASFYDYYQKLCNERERSGSKSNHAVWISALKHLKAYHGQADLTFHQINDDFLKGFKNFLLTQPLTKSDTKLAQNSAAGYFNRIRVALNQAYKDEIIVKNPAGKVDAIKVADTKREYLTLDELRALQKAECRYEVMKRAFLFSCLTGLRWSDIQKMTWSEVQRFHDSYRITFHQEKTEGLQYLDISDQAYKLMGQPNKPEQKVFKGLKYSAYHNTELARWCMRAGITKNITFHSGRHTFAVLQLSHGTEIYTLSKLLGHRELKTTQIYAKIMDDQKKQAMHKLPDIGI
jgi:integrase/recombinase XerD